MCYINLRFFVEIFNELTEVAQGFLAWSCAVESLRQLYIIAYCVYQLSRLMIPDADNIKRIIFKLVFDQFEVLTTVFKSAFSRLKALVVDGIGKSDWYF